MSNIEDFTIHVPESRLQQLSQRLALTVLPDELEDATPWERGVPRIEIRSILDHWKNKFSWRAAEERLNSLPRKMVSVAVDGFGTQSVHVLHLESSVPDAIPLLFLHGWPGSSIEATKIAPILADEVPGHPSFHVVAPDLINFGFSSGCDKVGFSADQHAEAYHKVMVSLGYDQYVVQGGDVGYAVARIIAHDYPESCKAHHINMVAAQEPDPETQPELFERARRYEPEPDEAARLARYQKFLAEGMAYAMMHSTRPQTLAYSMADSPVGLLAWIYEKLHDWSDNYPWSKDEILTWVSIYYFSTAGPWASQRWYYESSRSNPLVFDRAARYCNVLLGVSRFPKEPIQTPKPWCHALGPVVFQKDHQKGGHFAAWECPDLLCEDLRQMFGKDGGAYGCVQNRSGFRSP